MTETEIHDAWEAVIAIENELDDLYVERTRLNESASVMERQEADAERYPRVYRDYSERGLKGFVESEIDEIKRKIKEKEEQVLAMRKALGE